MFVMFFFFFFEGVIVNRCLFFFSSRRRHTSWPRDWSSDVCSSDLLLLGLGERAVGRDRLAVLQPQGGGGAGQVQRIARLEDAVLPEALAVLDRLVVDRLPFLLRHLSPQLLVPVHEKHVAHAGCPFPRPALAACHGPHDQKRLGPRRDRVGQRGVGQLVRQILLAGKEPHERAALLRDLVADRPAQHGIAGLERVEDRALGGAPLDVDLHFAVDVRQRPQMCREHDSDHGSVWTSTDTTDGRSRTMGTQLSPASADAYTCPPVVPKYTPHGSSESTAIASRNTLT